MAMAFKAVAETVAGVGTDIAKSASYVLFSCITCIACPAVEYRWLTR